MNVLFTILTVVIVCAPRSTAQELRTWQLKAGGPGIEASLISGKSDSVRLKRKGEKKTVTIPLSELSQADRDYVSMELAERKKKREWDSELRKVGDVVSMAYKTGSKFHGMSIHDPKYASKLEKLKRTKFKDPQLVVVARTMAELLSEQVRWARVASGWQDPEPLTKAEVEERIQSVNDAFNAGLGDDAAMGNLVNHMEAAFLKLSLNRSRAASNQRMLTKSLIKAWGDFVDVLEPKSGSETDDPMADLQFEYVVTKTGAIGRIDVPDRKLFVRNRTGQSLKNVILKVSSSASSGAAGTKTFYFFFSSWRSGKSIELPPESFDTIFSGALIGGAQLLPPSEAVRFQEGESVMRLSLWSEQLRRVQVDFAFTGKPKVKTKKTKLRSPFGGPSVVNEHSHVTMRLEESQ